ncbi:hypothetical protein [Anaeromyxobacter sp. SG64]|uniref:hypothetical protein n=1 Tax=Anaeromyxobacter sp. SG64 TaxID=2925409 RepID=UPI001F578135|nr:hypothetical protein [Anaeromyxobacter sp. SG64]
MDAQNPTISPLHTQLPLVAPAGTSQLPEQQSPFAVQLPPAAAHEDAGLHVPLVAPARISQTPEQQSPVAVQLPPSATHDDGLHVPLVAPATISQTPEQQSPVTVQLPPAAAHDGGLHAPLVAPAGRSHESPAQHSTLAVQLSPTRAHRTGGAATHVYLPWPPVGRQVDPPQQLVSAVPVHRAPSARQAKHRRIPARSATHRPWSQHCSLNWQTSPCGMHIQSQGDAQEPL